MCKDSVSDIKNPDNNLFFKKKNGNKNLHLSNDDNSCTLSEENNHEFSDEIILEHSLYKQLFEKFLISEKESQEFKNNWLLAKADFENLKRRSEKDIVNAHKYALEKFVYDLLDTVDNLERSISSKINENKELFSFYEGIELTLKSLLDTLKKFNVKQINPIRQVFDPEQHTAIATKEVDDVTESNIVIEVIQKGYLLNDRLLRPALVMVSKNKGN